MPEDGPPDARFFLGSIILPNDVVVVRVFRFDLGIADNDITESYPAPVLGPLMVDSSVLADKNFTKLGHAEQRILEDCMEQLKALGFHCISSPSNVPENKKEHLEALGIHFITSPKNAPGIKKECPEIWRFHVATYPKFVPGMTRLSPSLHAVGTPPTSGNSMDAEFILYLDSGAGHHVVHQAELLINLRDPPPGLTRVKAADGALLTVSYFGDIKTNDFLIPDVCLVKGLKANLVSVGQLVSSHKISCTFNSDGCEVTSYVDGSVVGSAVLRGDNQYVLSFLKIQ